MIHGIHGAFLVLGALTVLSAMVFHELKDDDGSAVSQHHVFHDGSDDRLLTGLPEV